MTTNDIKGTVQRDKIYVYSSCELCSSGEQVLVYECNDQLVCASHVREYIKANPAVQSCDRCHKPGALVRDPTHRRNEYLCLACHREDGFIINTSITAKAVREVLSPMKSVISARTKCEAAGYGTPCDDNVKPRGPWGGKSLCSTHGKTPPAPGKKK